MQIAPKTNRGTGIASQLGILLALFLLTFILVSIIQYILNQFNLDDRTELLICSGIQAILVFSVPSVIEASCESNKPFELLRATKQIELSVFLGILLIYFVGLPFLNQCIYYNEQFHFPESFRGIEDLFRKWEETNAQLTDILLSGNTVTDLIIEVIVIGVITGLSEELFFRAGLQRIFGHVMPTQISIWVTAVIFSAMHFQFFGFIPRLLLGAFFGYLYNWTGSIWASVLAHALNNSIVVITSWLVFHNYSNSNFDSLGITENGFPLIASISGAITIFVLAKYHKHIFKPIQK